MRKCRKCGETKSLEEFDKRKERIRAGGYTWRCKKCINEKRNENRSKKQEYYTKKVAEWREKNRERYNENHRNYRLKTKEERKKLYLYKIAKEYREQDSLYEKKKAKWQEIDWKKYINIYRLTEKENHDSRVKLGRAIVNGILERKKICEICKIDKSYEAHHHDYSKPLEVIWLCRTCHYELHNQERLNKEKK